MRTFLSILTNFFFILFSSLAILTYSLNATLLSPAFLKASLEEAKVYPALSRLISEQAGENDDPSMIKAITEQVIEDTFLWLAWKTDDPPTINLAPIQLPSIPFIPGEQERMVRQYFALYELVFPLSVALSMLIFVLRFLLPPTLPGKLRALSSSFLATGIPGLSVIVSPLLVKAAGQYQEFPEMLLPLKAPLLRFMEILVWRITLVQGVMFGMLVLIGFSFYLLSHFFTRQN